MIDALGAPQSVALLGGSSEIGLAVARRLVARRARRVVLAGRASEALSAARDDLAGRGAEVDVVDLDADAVDGHDAAVDALFAGGDLDVVVLAVGVLGDQERAEADADHAVAVARTTYLGPLSLSMRVAERLRAQGHGVLVVLSSVAADRARRSNYVYGSAKAGLDALAQGLDAALVGSGARVLVVRPGFVRTRMTEGMDPAPFATDPDVVAQAVEKALARQTRVVYAPGVLRPVMGVLKALPTPVFRRLPG